MPMSARQLLNADVSLMSLAGYRDALRDSFETASETEAPINLNKGEPIHD